MTFFSLVNLELHVQFAIIALMNRSVLGWISLFVIIFFNVIGQLFLMSWKPTPWLRLKMRSFEVMHACYIARLEVGDVSPTRSLKRSERGDDDDVSVSGYESMVMFLSYVGDLIQFFLAMAFVVRFGNSPVLTGVISVTVLFL